jgi:hypothetical protein
LPDAGAVTPPLDAPSIVWRVRDRNRVCGAAFGHHDCIRRIM